MNIQDFCFMHRGEIIKPLTEQDAGLLKAINKRGNQKKRALLLLHGYSSSPAVYRVLIPSLDMFDAIVCPLLPGHGDSLEAFTNAKAKDWQQAAEEACRILVEEYESVDVMGLSLGGVLACHLSSRFKINHLYLLAPALVLFRSALILFLAKCLYPLGLSKVRNRAGTIRKKNHAELTYKYLPLRSIIELLTYITEFQFVAPTCPVDIFLGYHDEVVDSNKVRLYFQDLPNASIHILQQSNHVLPLDQDVDEILRCIANNVAKENKAAE